MIHDNVELHNVAELRHEPDRGGYRLQRAPESVRTALNPGAQECLLQPDNAEIRYVASGPSQVTLSSHGQTRVSVFFGAFDSWQRAIVGREPQTIPIVPSEALDALADRYTADMPFSPRVVRLVLGGPERDPVLLHGVRRRGPPPAGGGRAAVAPPAHLRHLDHARLLRRGAAPLLRRARRAPPGSGPDQPGGGRLRALRAGAGRLHRRARRLARRQPGPVGQHAGLPDAGVSAARAVSGRPRRRRRCRPAGRLHHALPVLPRLRLGAAGRVRGLAGRSTGSRYATPWRRPDTPTRT